MNPRGYGGPPQYTTNPQQQYPYGQAGQMPGYPSQPGYPQGTTYPMHPVPAANNPAVVVVQTTREENPNYNSATIGHISNTRVSMGVIVVICSMMVSIFFWTASFYAAGYWCGLFFIATGSVGIASGKSPKNNGLIIAHVVMSILDAVLFALQLFILCTWIVSIPGLNWLFMTLYVVMMVCSFVQLILDIYATVLCLKALACGCCDTSTVVPDTGVQIHTTGTQQPVGYPETGNQHGGPYGGPYGQAQSGMDPSLPSGMETGQTPGIPGQPHTNQEPFPGKEQQN